VFRKVTIIGVGLIGGSLGKALRKGNLAQEIIGYGRRRTTLKKALQNGAVDKITLSPQKAVAESELVVICLPISQIYSYLKKVEPYLEKKVIILDVGSTKDKLLAKIEQNLRLDVSFIGCHPIAGSEKSGVEAAKANLFQGAVCVITPTRRTSPQALEVVTKLWQKLGSKPLFLSPSLHDALLAQTSHLPHLVAVGLVNTLSEASRKDALIFKLIGRGFLDTTRVSSSNPDIWLDICTSNRENILKALNNFLKVMKELRQCLTKKEFEKLRELLLKAKLFRDKRLKEL
jgi:prephenate dehydrogenase